MRNRSNEPLIKPQPKIKLEPCNFRIDTQTLLRLQAYSEFIDSEQGYVIREALNHLFENDPTFQEFFRSRLHTESEESKTR
jgi:hypothetical protein